MELLRTLTLVYAGILTVALAASLIAILFYLLRIARALGGVKEELGRTAARTEPIRTLLEPLRDEAGAAGRALEHAEADLGRADARLDALAARADLYERS